MPSLNQERYLHACGSYVNGKKKVSKLNNIVLYHTYLLFTFICQFIMVTGGKYATHFLDSTEIFNDNIWRTVTAKLPTSMDMLRVATINNRVLCFGNLKY